MLHFCKYLNRLQVAGQALWIQMVRDIIQDRALAFRLDQRYQYEHCLGIWNKIRGAYFRVLKVSVHAVCKRVFCCGRQHLDRIRLFRRHWFSVVWHHCISIPIMIAQMFPHIHTDLRWNSTHLSIDSTWSFKYAIWWMGYASSIKSSVKQKSLWLLSKFWDLNLAWDRAYLRRSCEII